jgi:hypothetical protein
MTSLRLGFSMATLFSEKHWVAGLIAPLTMNSQGALPESVEFNGATFA